MRDSSRNYEAQQERIQSKTSAGAKMLAESKRLKENLRSAPKNMAKSLVRGAGRIATSTGSMVSRGLLKIVPKRVIIIKK